jgi:hypothetical protein
MPSLTGGTPRSSGSASDDEADRLERAGRIVPVDTLEHRKEGIGDDIFGHRSVAADSIGSAERTNLVQADKHFESLDVPGAQDSKRFGFTRVLQRDRNILHERLLNSTIRQTFN